MQKFYMPEEVARLLRVDNLTVRRWLNNGNLKGLRIGRLWRIGHSELEEFLALKLGSIEDELRQSEERNRALVDMVGKAGTGIMMFQDTNNRKGVIIFANDEVFRLSGYSRRELLGKSFSRFLPPDIAVEQERRYTQRQNGEYTPVQCEIEVKRKDGTPLPLEVVVGTTNYDGKSTIVAYFRDISERRQIEKQLRESEEKLRLMFESINKGVIATDLDARIVHVNKATMRLHGYNNNNKEELIGRSALEFIAEKDRVRAMENMKKTLEEGYVRNIEYTFLKRNGDEFPAELSAAAIRDASGNPTGFVAITDAIT